MSRAPCAIDEACRRPGDRREAADPVPRRAPVVVAAPAPDRLRSRRHGCDGGQRKGHGSSETICPCCGSNAFSSFLWPPSLASRWDGTRRGGEAQKNRGARRRPQVLRPTTRDDRAGRGIPLWTRTQVAAGLHTSNQGFGGAPCIIFSHGIPIPPEAIEPAVQKEWADSTRLRRARRSPEAQVLLRGDASLSVGQAAHGARAQLHDQRRALPLHAHEGLQRPLPDGLGRLRPARRERGDGERRAAGEVDVGQHRLHEAAVPGDGLRDRLDARGRHLLARLLPLEPVVLPAHVGEGHRLQEDRRRELGPGRHDRARQRAGDRRQGLAHRRHGREARDPDVVHADHAIRRRAASMRSTASAGPSR